MRARVWVQCNLTPKPLSHRGRRVLCFIIYQLREDGEGIFRRICTPKPERQAHSTVCWWVRGSWRSSWFIFGDKHGKCLPENKFVSYGRKHCLTFLFQAFVILHYLTNSAGRGKWSWLTKALHSLRDPWPFGHSCSWEHQSISGDQWLVETVGRYRIFILVLSEQSRMQ